MLQNLLKKSIALSLPPGCHAHSQDPPPGCKASSINSHWMVSFNDSMTGEAWIFLQIVKERNLIHKPLNLPPTLVQSVSLPSMVFRHGAAQHGRSSPAWQQAPQSLGCVHPWSRGTPYPFMFFLPIDTLSPSPSFPEAWTPMCTDFGGYNLIELKPWYLQDSGNFSSDYLLKLNYDFHILCGTVGAFWSVVFWIIHNFTQCMFSHKCRMVWD